MRSGGPASGGPPMGPVPGSAPAGPAPGGEVPPPPPGPGVMTPFAVPPGDRDRRRTATVWGVGAAVAVLVFGGGAVGVGALVVTSERAAEVQARTVVTDYLDGLARGDYARAYQQICTVRRQSEPLSRFTERERGLTPIRSFRVEKAKPDENIYRVPADVTTADGRTAIEKYLVINDNRAGSLRVCGGPR